MKNAKAKLVVLREDFAIVPRIISDQQKVEAQVCFLGTESIKETIQRFVMKESKEVKEIPTKELIDLCDWVETVYKECFNSPIAGNLTMLETAVRIKHALRNIE